MRGISVAKQVNDRLLLRSWKCVGHCESLADRIVSDAPQLSTDGFIAYPNAVKNAFGDEITYGQIIKEYAEPVQSSRYGPPVMVAAVTLHVAHYNFCRVHCTLRITPAMAAGGKNHGWEPDALLAAI